MCNTALFVTVFKLWYPVPYAVRQRTVLGVGYILKILVKDKLVFVQMYKHHEIILRKFFFVVFAKAKLYHIFIFKRGKNKFSLVAWEEPQQ